MTQAKKTAVINRGRHGYILLFSAPQAEIQKEIKTLKKSLDFQNADVKVRTGRN